MTKEDVQNLLERALEHYSDYIGEQNYDFPIYSYVSGVLSFEEEGKVTDKFQIAIVRT